MPRCHRDAHETNWTIATNIREYKGEPGRVAEVTMGIARVIFSIHEKQIASHKTGRQVPDRNCEKRSGRSS